MAWRIDGCEFVEDEFDDRPEFPAWGFADLDAAGAWVARFVRKDNEDHRHSPIR